MILHSIAGKVDRGTLITGIVIGCLFASTTLWGADPGTNPDNGATMLAELRRKVEQAEKLYQNTDLHYREKFENGTAAERELRKNPATAKSNFARLIDQNLSAHLILQYPWYRVDEQGISQIEGGAELTSKFEMVFDGKMSRSRRTTTRVSLSDAPPNPQTHVMYDWDQKRIPQRFTLGPHLVLWNLADLYVVYPLSLILTGDETYTGLGATSAPAAVPAPLPTEPLPPPTQPVLVPTPPSAQPAPRQPDAAKTYWVEYSGQEEVDGYPCEKITIRNQRQVTVAWLAENRNSLPVKLEFFQLGLSDQPVITARTVKFREDTPGVWYPVECEALHYSKTSSGKKSNSDEGVSGDNDSLEQSGRKEFLVDDLNFSPKYAQSQFEGIPIPLTAKKNSFYEPAWTMQKTVTKVNENRNQFSHLIVGMIAHCDLYLEKWIGDNGVSKILRFSGALIVVGGGYLFLRRRQRRKNQKDDLPARPPENAAL